MILLIRSVLFRVHEGVKIGSDFLLKVGSDFAFCSIGEIIRFQELCDVWPISFKQRYGIPNFILFFLFPFVDVVFVLLYALEYTVLTSRLIF